MTNSASFQMKAIYGPHIKLMKGPKNPLPPLSETYAEEKIRYLTSPCKVCLTGYGNVMTYASTHKMQSIPSDK